MGILNENIIIKPIHSSFRSKFKNTVLNNLNDSINDT